MIGSTLTLCFNCSLITPRTNPPREGRCDPGHDGTARHLPSPPGTKERSQASGAGSQGSPFGLKLLPCPQLATEAVPPPTRIPGSPVWAAQENPLGNF